jgi:hypothetical protein
MKPPWWVRLWHAYSTLCPVSVVAFIIAGAWVIVRELLAGRNRAEEIAAEGVEWGEELLHRWQSACENYCDRYGVPME